MIYQVRKRTKLEDIVYSLHHLYFSSGLSLRNTSKALSKSVHRSHAAIRDFDGFKNINQKDCFITK